MRMKLFMALLLFFAASASAQAQSVSGTVYAAGEDEPLIGATVKVKGSKLATATDVDGRFTLRGLSPADQYLEVSYVGYQTATVAVKPEMKIYLNQETEMLDEMIVVAFGKQKRESFTGSASVIGAEQIARAQVTNPIEALNGTVTGLNMTESNSFGTDPKITIRGIGSLNAGTDPLIVLDGMPYAGAWNDINPADIASMTVLKDAASNALYGARGANGVILISTKSAQRGKTSVNLTAKWGANSDGRVEYDLINDPGQYYEAFYLAQKNYFMNERGQHAALAHVSANDRIGLPATEGGLGYMVYTVPQGETLIGSNGRLNPNATLGNRVANNGEIYTLYPDDWLKEGLRTGFRQEYNLSVSTGSDKYTLYTSLGYLGNEGLARGNELERYTARMKADAQIYPFLKIGATASYNHTVTNVNSNVFSIPTEVGPIYPLYLRDMYGNIMTDQHGPAFDYGDGSILGVPRPVDSNGNYVQEDMLNLYKNVTNAFNIQGFATVDFLDGFHFTVNGSVFNAENRWNTGSNPYYGFETGIGSVFTSHGRNTDFNTQQLLNYSKTFGNHSLDALLGHEYTRRSTTYLSADRNKVSMWESNKEINGAIADASMSGYSTNYNVEGWFLRAQYDYDSRYFASASFRRDGSSRFHPDHRWGNFWSVGAAWIMSKEEWFPKDAFVNMLKLKLSYGEQGNDNIGNFRYVDTYEIRNTNGQTAFVFDTKGNPDISWETTGSLNAGLEFELLDTRISGGLEFYSRTTRDMLMWFSTPPSLGYSGYYDNIGDMRNTGLELTLNADIIASSAFTWNVGLNLSWEKNRVTRLPEAKRLAVCDGYEGYLSSWEFIGEGLPVYTWRLPKFAGVNDQGLSLFYYTDADGNLATTTDYSAADYYLCGSALPKVFGGFNTSFRFFGVDLGAQFNYSIGGKKLDSMYQSYMTPPYQGLTGRPLHKDVFNAWTRENPSSSIPRFQYGEYNSTNTSDRFLTDASYLGLRNITVGYTFPKSLLKKIRVASLRVFCQAENVYYWSKRKGFDPRMGALYGNDNGDEYGAIGQSYSFPMRTVSGGLSVEF